MHGDTECSPTRGTPLHFPFPFSLVPSITQVIIFHYYYTIKSQFFPTRSIAACRWRARCLHLLAQPFPAVPPQRLGQPVRRGLRHLYAQRSGTGDADFLPQGNSLLSGAGAKAPALGAAAGSRPAEPHLSG